MSRVFGNKNPAGGAEKSRLQKRSKFPSFHIYKGKKDVVVQNNASLFVDFFYKFMTIKQKVICLSLSLYIKIMEISHP